MGNRTKLLLAALAPLILLGLALVLRYVILTPAPPGLLSVKAVAPAKSAAPGEFITQVFTVRNKSAVQESYQLELSLSAPRGWPVISPLEPMTIVPGRAEKVFVTLQVPHRTPAGDYRVSLRASVQGDPGIGANGRALVRVKATPLPQVEPRSPRAEAEAGSEIELHFIVTNQGNTRGTFRLKTAAPAAWEAELPQDRVELGPGESQEVRIAIYVPADALPGPEKISFKAIAKGQEAEAAIKVAVLPR